MRIYILSLIIVVAFGVKAQIGVNTDNPRQLFHLDGASTPATTNPATGVVSVAQAVDDVVVDGQGRMGIGTTSPTAKLHIEDKRIGENALKIVDGTEGFSTITNLENVSVNIPHMLSSTDNVGTTRWQSQPMPEGFVDHIAPALTFPYGSATTISSFVAPQAGNYMVTIRWWGTIHLVPAPVAGSAESRLEYTTSAYFYLNLRNPITNTVVNRDLQEYYLTKGLNVFMSFTTTLFANVPVAGQVLELTISPVKINERTFDWKTKPALNSAKEHLPSIVYFKI